jgi:hypothetical protein
VCVFCGHWNASCSLRSLTPTAKVRWIQHSCYLRDATSHLEYLLEWTVFAAVTVRLASLLGGSLHYLAARYTTWRLATLLGGKASASDQCGRTTWRQSKRQ